MAERSQDTNKLIGERVRYYRNAKDMSMQDVAVQIPYDITYQQLANYETGKSRWPADLIVILAKLFRVDVRLLMGLEDGKHEGKDNGEWEGERYKIMLMKQPMKVRRLIYHLIQKICTLKYPDEGNDGGKEPQISLTRRLK